ncbi:MAG: Ig-like domain-containing protein, partial [Bacteroidaceae bacterium]|nr:Ig-like domain-containing protein [Bacteroidaceae bacterium]
NEDEDLYEYFRRYRTIILHFEAGGTDIQKPALVGTLKTGFKAEDDEDTYMAFYFLWRVFNQLKMSVDEETEEVVFSSLADKVLFSFDENGIFTIAPGVTSADDIIYTITQEGRDNLINTDPGVYEFILPYSAIELHFDTSGGSGDPKTIGGTLGTGINVFYGEEYKLLNIAIKALASVNYLTKVFNQPENSLMYYLTETNKFLFSVDSHGIATVSPDLTDDDDILYTITDADRTAFEQGGIAKDLAPYETIKIHFGKLILPTSIKMDIETLEFTSIGQQQQLTAIISPDNAADKTLKWYSTSSSVASVDQNGLVTAKGEGEAFIVAATVNELLASCKVTVKLEPYVGGKLGNQGTWSFADGVLTVDYVGAMPQNCTSKTTDPEIAYRLKWIDFLSEIKEIVITGVDVEVQPYFLYYSGDGPDGTHPDDHIKKLTLGSGVKKVGKQAFASYDLKDVYCYGVEPPELSSDTGNGNVFWKKRIQANQAFLHLVKGASTGYARINSEWAIFNHSAHALDPEDDPVEIVSPLGETEEGAGAWYSLDGRKLSGKP